jgi:hypothetical protein
MAERGERTASKDTLARGSKAQPRETPTLADLGVTKTQSSNAPPADRSGGQISSLSGGALVGALLPLTRKDGWCAHLNFIEHAEEQSR